MWKAHQKYGNFVRYGPNQLLVNTPKGIKDVYGTKSSDDFLKSKHYNVLSHLAANTFTHRGGKDHMRRRRVMALSASGQAVKEYESKISYHVDEFCNIVFPADDREWSQPFDMAKWCNYLSFDMMADVIFGAHYNLLGDERFRYVPEMLEMSNVRMSALVQFPGLSRFRLDKYLFTEAIFARNRFLKFVMRLVRDRMQLSKGIKCGIYEKSQSASVSERSDLYSKLAETTDPQTGATLQGDEIAAESITLVVAGSDTAACTIASAMFYLADNPSAYVKAAEEVRSRISTSADLTGIKLSACVYLRACIDEALRMSPAVGSALYREVVSDSGTMVDKNFIPPGVDVGTGTYAAHHNAQCFPDPFAYIPERWLESHSSRESIDKARSCFVPFSIGTRSCVGKSLAYAEITLVLAALFFSGDFRFADGELGYVGRGSKNDEHGRHRSNEYQLYDHIAGQKNGPWLQFAKREQLG
ncbi:Cytochrome P450 monooxygenase apf8 [Lachnellula suecica]|uniref:Cytochrome P450 monooxygenase apf8 n=1 Tax=Lachnellula suecica TaxID=602035 RepID=A0A8T9CMA2_9HELO|nr:Cytochrome P450 monooxygenase apf8 [Lachnellula suecica]